MKLLIYLKNIRWIVILISLMCINACSFMLNDEMKRMINEQAAPRLQDINFTYDLTEIKDRWPEFEFAADGSEYLLCWWLEIGSAYPEGLKGRYVPENKRFGTSIVLDFDGNIVDATEGDGKILKKEFIDLFPKTMYRQKWKEFIKCHDAWGFSNDSCYSIRLLENTTTYVWSGELWQFCGEKQLLWKNDNITRIATNPLIEFVKYNNEKSILIAFKKNFVLSQANGEILDSFGYGPEDTIEVLKKRKSKFHIWCPENVDECDLDFSSNRRSYNPEKRLLASGDSHSQRVRIVSIDPPHEMLSEINSDLHPRRPWGGHWRVNRVEFNHTGKYLIVEYVFQGRGTSKTYVPTEIYDTDSWKCCWFENSLDVREVTLSPDGKMIAFKRGNFLEVGPFQPHSGISND